MKECLLPDCCERNAEIDIKTYKIGQINMKTIDGGVNGA